MGIRDDILADLLPEMDVTGELFDAVEQCTFKRITGGGWDADNMQPLPSTEEVISSRGFYLGFTITEREALEIQQGDVKFIIMADQVRPLQSEVLTIKGSDYSVVDILKFPTDVGSAYWLRKVGV